MPIKISELTAEIQKTGIMNSNSYVVRILFPKSLNNLSDKFGDMVPRIQRINLPERALATIQQKSSYRESINIPKGYSGFTDLSMSILLSSDMREKKLLMAWHDLIISPKNNFHPTYLDDIGGMITIITFGDKNTDTDMKKVEQHDFYKCYPLTVGDVELSYTSTDEAATIDTTFTYSHFTMESGNFKEILGSKMLGDVKRAEKKELAQDIFGGR